MTQEYERKIESELIRTMIALDDLATQLAWMTKNDKDKLMQDSLEKAGNVVKIMPPTFRSILLRRAGLTIEDAIDVNANH